MLQPKSIRLLFIERADGRSPVKIAIDDDGILFSYTRQQPSSRAVPDGIAGSRQRIVSELRTISVDGTPVHETHWADWGYRANDSIM